MSKNNGILCKNALHHRCLTMRKYVPENMVTSYYHDIVLTVCGHFVGSCVTDVGPRETLIAYLQCVFSAKLSKTNIFRSIKPTPNKSHAALFLFHIVFL